MCKGWVYGLVNDELKGVVKIGMTTVCPRRRAANTKSGLTTPFRVEFAYKTVAPAFIEKTVHAALAHRKAGFRREYFKIGRRTARELVRKTISEVSIDV